MEKKDGILKIKNDRPKNIMHYKDLIRFQLVSYFSARENIELSKINSYFFKAVKEHFEDWKNELSLLAVKFSLDLENSKIDYTKLEAIKNESGYLIKNTNANYIQFLIEGYRHYALARGERWAHYDNINYWEKCQLKNGTFGGFSYHLISVCWLDLSLNFHNVKTDIYDVYLRQALDSYNDIECCLTVKVILITENEKITIFTSPFMKEEMIKELSIHRDEFPMEKSEQGSYRRNYNSPSLLKDCLLTRIDLRKFTNSPECKISISFWHENGDWKSGWYIDGAFLEKCK